MLLRLHALEVKTPEFPSEFIINLAHSLRSFASSLEYVSVHQNCAVLLRLVEL